MKTLSLLEFHKISKTILITICLFFLSIVTINAQGSNPNDNWITLATKNPELKLIWVFDIGFFMALSALCALAYLFFRRNQIVLWYMSLMVLLTLAYTATLLPYYFTNPFVAFFFYFAVKLVQSGGLICGIKILQSLAESENQIRFQRLFIMGIVGLVCCFCAYFYLKLYDILSILYYTSCLFLLYENIATVVKGVKRKQLEFHFIILYSIISVLFAIQAFPITGDNDNSVSDLRLWVNILLPFTIACFLALIFVKYSKSFFQREAEVKALELEKQVTLEKQNETLAKRVSEQTSELQNLNNTKDRLFSIIGHDLRSPIASLKGIMELIDNQQLSREEFQDLLKHLQKNVDNVYLMLENLLQWSLSQMKGFKPNLKGFEINEMIEETVELFRETAKQKQIDLRCDVPENLGIFADVNHIQIILRNLLSNAIKFTPQNGQVAVNGIVRNNFVELKIIDSGIGIKNEDLSTIFSKPKLKAGTSGEKSTGIGLILCQELIKQNGGKITVTNNLNNGTTFNILLNAMQNQN